MNATIGRALEYLDENAVDLFQRHIVQKDILGQPVGDALIGGLRSSKRYRQLADEQLHEVDCLPASQPIIGRYAEPARRHALQDLHAAANT